MDAIYYFIPLHIFQLFKQFKVSTLHQLNDLSHTYSSYSELSFMYQWSMKPFDGLETIKILRSPFLPYTIAKISSNSDTTRNFQRGWAQLIKPLNPAPSTWLKGSSSIIIILARLNLCSSWLNSTSLKDTLLSPSTCFPSTIVFVPCQLPYLDS